MNRYPASLIALCSAGFAVALAAGDEMNVLKLHVDSFTMVGIEARTSNAREMNGTGVIGKMWDRLRNEKLLSQIHNRADGRTVALYTDYESDKDGPYTYVLGAKVTSAKDIPAGMVSRKIESGTYAMFTAEGGPPPRMVVDLWKRIWSLEKAGPLSRAYKTDFEVYGSPHQTESKEPDTHIDVYVGLKDRH